METNVLEFLENASDIYGNKTAVKDGNVECTFSELCSNAKRVGSALLEKQIFGRAIPVYMEKGIEALEAFWGITYAGGCYSLMNPIQPSARIEKILDILNAPCLITNHDSYAGLSDVKYKGQILFVEDLIQYQVDEDGINRVRERSIDIDALYVNFTSGSTGIPKGVVVSHRSVIEFMRCFVSIFHITSEDIIGNQAPFDFDVSVKDIYSMLMTGATVCIIPKDFFSFPKKILDILVQEKVTTLIWAVSALCTISSLRGFTYKIPTAVNKVLFSGEVMPLKHLQEWRQALPQAMFVNLYGPTEITCNCTYYKVEQECQGTIPIGKAFPNEKVFLLNESQNEVCAVNVEGEICVAGTTLALGYYGDLERTQNVFVQNPLNSYYHELIYRTGDIAYYREDGNLVYVGRKDLQIKHLGHRIELGELETYIGMMQGIDRVCCLYDDIKQQIVTVYQGKAEKSDIKKELRKKVVKYMIPQRYIIVEQMPLTPNGKIDRKQLRAEYFKER